MDYRKQIYYLDYYENGIKGKALGHIVWQERHGKCEFDVSVSKLERLFLGQASVLLLFDKTVENVGVMDIKEGHGEKNFYIGKIENRPIGVRISLTSGKWLEKVWETESENVIDEPVDTEGASVTTKKMIEEKNMENPSKLTEWDENVLENYHICHPFGTDEEYYSVEADILQKMPETKTLENNSFLLHGYYNYRHLILKKIPNGTITIGVPGVYYEREKKVAAMYGFHLFKGIKNMNNAGCFGYYMQEI